MTAQTADFLASVPMFSGLQRDELLKFADGGAVFLEVRTDNEAAIALYRSMGFDQIGRRPGYYNGADAYTMGSKTTGSVLIERMKIAGA